MTKLEAVNELLDAIGEDPVSSLTSGLDDAESAERVLDRVSRRIQKQGWHCNTDHKITLVRDIDGYIAVPSNTLRIDTSGTSSDVNVVKRASRLYDIKNKTFVFTKSLVCRIVYKLDFGDLTSALQDYIAAIAARDFQSSVMGSVSLDAFTARSTSEAWTSLMAEESENDDTNVLDNPSSRRITRRNNHGRAW